MTESFTTIMVETIGPVARLMLSRPERANALNVDASALREWLLVRTERSKVPDVFHFRDVLPSGSSGKADRRAVAQLASAN
jgi:acyl-CoA synthetase (AMP-forming)/AMP-acid ligase II